VAQIAAKAPNILLTGLNNCMVDFLIVWGAEFGFAFNTLIAPNLEAHNLSVGAFRPKK